MVDTGFRCDFARFEERIIVGVRGEVDVATASVLERDLRAILAPPVRSVVLDLAYVSVLDSAGIAALLHLRDRAQELGIELNFTSVPRHIEKALRSSGLDEAFS